jgi:hypothetical protein
MRKRTMRFVAGCAIGAGLAAAGAPLFAGGGPGCRRPLVVHEWGTFTSMSGEDGVALEGLSREEESLPSFVYSRSEVRDCPLREKGWKGLEVPADHVTQKMETPVIYFHSDVERRVRVRVDFRKGLLSQWYPVSDLLGPAEGARDAGPLDVSKVESSFLQWDVDVLPRGVERPSEVPAVDAADPWSFARDVDANWIRTVPRKGPERAGPTEAERYLFYRGLGSFPLPLSATAAMGGALTLRNSGDVAIPFAVALDVRGDKARLVCGDGIPAKGEKAVSFGGEENWFPLENAATKLESWVSDVLRKQGLAEDEARAMVRTWARSWFRSEGTRVMWIVPRATTDAILPLSIDPAPDELVRVLVGRLEVILPETAEEVIAAAKDAVSDDAARKARGDERLARLGRFLEPHLRNVLRITKGADARKAASVLLARLAAADGGR